MFYNASGERGVDAVRGRQSACCFTGHRPVKLPWRYNESDPRCLALKTRLYAAAESVIRDGTEHFICGMAEGCDIYFGEIVLELKRRYPNITLEAALPCPSQAEQWDRATRVRYRALLARCDYETMVSAQYSSGCMQRRNRYMVDHSSVLIAAHDGFPGGTRSTIEYAIRRGLKVVDVPILEE